MNRSTQQNDTGLETSASKQQQKQLQRCAKNVPSHVSRGRTHPQRGRRVSFSSTQEHIILPDESNTDLRSRWHSEQEGRELVLSMKPDIRALRRGIDEDSDNSGLCYLGLEHFESKATLEEQVVGKDRNIQAVLNVQQRQRSGKSTKSAYAVALASMLTSDEATQRAVDLGAATEVAARDHTADVRFSAMPLNRPSAHTYSRNSSNGSILSTSADGTSINGTQNDVVAVSDLSREMASLNKCFSSTGSNGSLNSHKSSSSSNTVPLPPQGEKSPNVEQAFAA